MSDIKPHPSNIPGDYFVEDGCCTSCGVPLLHAADLFEGLEWPNGNHCYVKRQPETPDEHDRMFLTIQMAEFSCIHYRGSDRQIQERLVEAGEGQICHDLPDDLRQRVESHQ